MKILWKFFYVTAFICIQTAHVFAEESTKTSAIWEYVTDDRIVRFPSQPGFLPAIKIDDPMKNKKIWLRTRSDTSEYSTDSINIFEHIPGAVDTMATLEEQVKLLAYVFKMNCTSGFNPFLQVADKDKLVLLMSTCDQIKEKKTSAAVLAAIFTDGTRRYTITWVITEPASKIAPLTSKEWVTKLNALFPIVSCPRTKDGTIVTAECTGFATK